MKKILTLTLMAFALCHAYSQDFNYGFGAGLNYSGFAFDNIYTGDQDYKTGFRINAILTCDFNDKAGVSLEPGLALRGTVLNNPGTKIDITYLILPAVFKYTFFDRLTLSLGPEFSYRLTAKATTDISTTDLSSVYDSKIDLGINAGISYRLIDQLAIGLKYNRGFIPTIKDLRVTDEYGNDKGRASICNQGFSVSLIYMIR